MFELEDGLQIVGCFTAGEIKNMAASQRLHPAMRIRKLPDGKWQPITSVRGINVGAAKVIEGRVVETSPSRELVVATPSVPAIYTEPDATLDFNVACPFCAEVIHKDAKKCKHCGEILDPLLRAAMQSHTPSININNVNTNTNVPFATHPRYYQAWNPALAVILSFIWPGLGQIYKGEVAGGILWMIIVFIGYMVFIIPGLVLHLCCAIAAGLGNPNRTY